MELGDIVQLTHGGRKGLDYIKCPYDEWLFIITGKSEDGLDYYIDSLEYVSESNSVGIIVGDGSSVMEEDIEVVNYSEEEIFNILKTQANCF